MRALPVAATLLLGLHLRRGRADARTRHGFPRRRAGGMPGQAPPPQQQQQEPPCFREFAPMSAEAEKRAGVMKAAMEKKVPREEACGHSSLSLRRRGRWSNS